MLGLVPLLASLNDDRWTETFYRKIAQQQHPANGAWPRPQLSISRTFAYVALHRATGRVAPLPQKTVDTVLSLQRESAFLWGKAPSFGTLDAAYILVRLPSVINSYRRDEARQVLERLAVAMEEFYAHNAERVMANPHWMLSIVHTFGPLQEAFPEKYPSQRPYRFDWDKPSMYYCDVIANAAGKPGARPRPA